MRMHISKNIARLKLQEYDKDTLINYIIANSPVDFEKLDEIENELKDKRGGSEYACIRNKQ